MFGSFPNRLPASQQPGAANGTAGGEAARAAGAANAQTSQEAAAPITRAADSQAAGSPKKAEMAVKPVRQSLKPTVAATGDARRAGRSSSARGEYGVNVLVEVKNGRVTKARVLNPRRGAGDYESLALKTARQQRYPDNFNGAERLKVRVKP